MTNWNFDISTIPLDRKIIVETTDGEVHQTIFNKPTKHTKDGWFSMIGPLARIIAWQDFPAPSRMGVAAKAAGAPVILPIIDDVGSI